MRHGEKLNLTYDFKKNPTRPTDQTKITESPSAVIHLYLLSNILFITYFMTIGRSQKTWEWNVPMADIHCLNKNNLSLIKQVVKHFMKADLLTK